MESPQLKLLEIELEMNPQSIALLISVVMGSNNMNWITDRPTPTIPSDLGKEELYQGYPTSFIHAQTKMFLTTIIKTKTMEPSSTIALKLSQTATSAYQPSKTNHIKVSMTE